MHRPGPLVDRVGVVERGLTRATPPTGAPAGAAPVLHLRLHAQNVGTQVDGDAGEATLARAPEAHGEPRALYANAVQNLANLIESVITYSDEASADYDRRVRLFGQLAGIFDPVRIKRSRQFPS